MGEVNFYYFTCLKLAHRGLNLVSLPACLWKCSNHGLYFYTLGEHLESFFPSSYFYLYSGFCPGWIIILICSVLYSAFCCLSWFCLTSRLANSIIAGKF